MKSHSSPWFSAACAAVIAHRNHDFCLYQQNKSSTSKVKFRSASNHYKRVLKATKLAFANKTKEYITSQKLGFRDFGKLLIVFVTKVIPPLFSCPEASSSTSDKAKFFAENFSLNSDLDASGIYLSAFLSRTNLRLHIISVTPKFFKKVITNTNMSKASGPDYIPVVVLKNCKPKLSCV